MAQRRAFSILKVLFAITLALLAIAGISYRIAQMHQKATSSVFDSSNDSCAFKNDTAAGTAISWARLEPPISVHYLGFSIDWQVG
jgi:hypothetical protein